MSANDEIDSEISIRLKKRSVELKNLESNNENEAKRNKIRKEENPVQEEKFTESKTSEQLASVKSLRSRWEISSSAGTSLHPDRKSDELLRAAINMASGPAIKLSNKRNIGKLFESGFDEHTSIHEESPKRMVHSPRQPLSTKPLASVITESLSPKLGEEDKKDVEESAPTTIMTMKMFESDDIPFSSCAADDDPLEETESKSGSENKSLSIDLGQIDSTDANDKKVPNSPHGSSYRPVTPNTDILGSLWDDINRELEKCKANKTEGGNTSPKSHHNTDRPAVHTLSNYRRLTRPMSQDYDIIIGSTSSEIQRSIAPSMLEGYIDETDSTQIEDFSTIHPHSMVSLGHNEGILKRIHESILVQQDQICQATRALSFCRQNENYRGGREEIDAQRALLISTERRRAFMLERDRIIKGKIFSVNGPTGKLTISHVAIKLSRDFINTYMHRGSNRYYFMVLIKSGDKVLHTTVGNSDQGIKTGYIEFSHYIQLDGLSPDFVCDLEVFSLRASQDAVTEKNKGKMGTLQKLLKHTPLGAGPNTTIGGRCSSSRSIVTMDQGFQKIGHLTLNRLLLSRQKFILSDTSFPLEGGIVLTMRCCSEAPEEVQQTYRNFLSVHQNVGGFGSWTRFWCVLSNSHLKFWRYPEDEDKKAPEVVLDLDTCMSEVTPVNPSAATFPHSMQVEILLIEGTRRETIMMVFAADTQESKEIWSTTINQSIRNANIWNVGINK